MPSPLPLPIRVMVKGASTVNWVSPMGGPRTDFAFSRVIEAELLAAGRPTEMRVISAPSELTSRTLLNWEREFLGWSPDVVVLVYGHYETVHLFLPRWLERHANSLRSRPRRLTKLYRTYLLRPVWMFLARLQARLDTRFPTMRPQRPIRVANDLEALTVQLQKLHSPLMIIVELVPPAKRYRSWFPGMTARIAIMNETISAMVERLDKPNVRYFRTSELVRKYADDDLDIATPDGFHFSVDLHARIGAELAREIQEWADTQPHLQVAKPRRRPRAPGAEAG